MKVYGRADVVTLMRVCAFARAHTHTHIVVPQRPSPSVLWAGPGMSDAVTLWEGNSVLKLRVQGSDPVAYHHISYV